MEENNENKRKSNKTVVVIFGIIIVILIAVVAILLLKLNNTSINGTTENGNGNNQQISNNSNTNTNNKSENNKGTAENDTALGLNFIKIDSSSQNLTDEQKTVIQYFDNDYFDANDYQFLVRYPQIYEKMQITTHGKVEKIIKSDNDSYELLLWVGESEAYYSYWTMYRGGSTTPYSEYVEKNKNNYIVIKGTQGDSRLIQGDWITLYGRYISIDQYTIDGTSYTIPTVNIYNYQNDSESARPDGTPDRFSLSFIRKVAKAIFNNGVIVRQPTSDEAVITSNSFMNNPVYICELDNQSNSKFGKYFFNVNYAHISDTRNQDEYVFADGDGTGINRYIEFAPDFEHFFMFIYDENNKYLTIEYYDKDFKRIWSRDFEDTLSGTYDYTENNIYLVANNYLYTINTSTGKDTFAKRYVGEKVLVRKLQDSILLFSAGNADNIMKTDLQGNILWTASVTNSYGSYTIQKKDNTLITNGFDSNGKLFYVVINLENGNIELKADSK